MCAVLCGGQQCCARLAVRWSAWVGSCVGLLLPLHHIMYTTGMLQLKIKGMLVEDLHVFKKLYCRHLLGITKLDKEKNQSIREKTGTQNIVKEIKQYQQKWLQHVQRMGKNRLPKQALRYKPKGRRNLGRPRKRWTDQIHLED